jgi:hypothetical protein
LKPKNNRQHSAYECRARFKKTPLTLLRKNVVYPPLQDADFVVKMEDILEVYKESYNAEIPVICLDEKPYQLLDER